MWRGSSPAGLLHLLPVGLRSSWEGTLWCSGVLIVPAGTGTIWDGQSPFAQVINEQRVADVLNQVRFLHHMCLESSIVFRQESLSCPGVSLYIRELLQIAIFFLPGRGKYWLK